MSTSSNLVEPAQRVWTSSGDDDDDHDDDRASRTWLDPVSHSQAANLEDILHDISTKELDGGRMRQKQLGVLREDPSEDMRLLMENYTVAALASALRDREELLQQCAELCKNGQLAQVAALLQPFQHEFVKERRYSSGSKLRLDQELTRNSLEILRKALMRMPRRVVHAHQRRAGVVLALANVNGIPCVLLEKRAANLRSHPGETSLPGGMVCSVSDQTIVSTCLREMQEEIGGLYQKDFTVLGVLRCNWGKVHHLVGLAVTPVCCFVGDLTDAKLTPNPSEVSQVFTIPLSTLLKRNYWIHRQDFAPVFVGGPHVIFGLTGYILNRFVNDILTQYDVGSP